MVNPIFQQPENRPLEHAAISGAALALSPVEHFFLQAS